MENLDIIYIILLAVEIIAVGVTGWMLRIVLTLWKDVKFSHSRHDVTDTIIGLQIKTRYNSSRIAKGLDPFPELTHDKA